MDARKKTEEIVTVALGCMLADLVLPFLKDATKKVEEYVETKKGGGK